jgi:hypothetical protein
MSEVAWKRGLITLGIVGALVVVALAAGQTTSQKASAQAPVGGMGLAIPGATCEGDECFVEPGAPFTVALVSTVLPVPISGFGAEVFFGGLVYTLAPCDEQVQVTPTAICASLAGPAGQARLAVGSGVVPPLEALNATEGGTLALLDATCADSGSFELALSAVTVGPDSAPFGAIYFDLTPTEFNVATQGTEVLDPENTGSTTPIAVADTITVTCEGAVGEPPTPTPMSPVDAPLPTLVDTGSGGSDSGGGAGAGWLLVATGVLLALTLSGFGLHRWKSAGDLRR